MPSTSPLVPVAARKTVHDLVYEQLREALISGAFEADESFTIAALARRFGTSHMPVREALRRLAAENALKISTSGTAFVPGLSRAELDDISLARVILEGATAALAFDRLDPADRAELQDCIARHQAAGESGDVASMTAENRFFHFRIYRAAASPVLMSQIENLWLRSGPYVRFLSDRMGDLLRGDYRNDFTRHHARMLAAADAGAFRAALEDDIRASQSLIHRYLSG